MPFDFSVASVIIDFPVTVIRNVDLGNVILKIFSSINTLLKKVKDGRISRESLPHSVQFPRIAV